MRRSSAPVPTCTRRSSMIEKPSVRRVNAIRSRISTGDPRSVDAYPARRSAGMSGATPATTKQTRGPRLVAALRRQPSHRRRRQIATSCHGVTWAEGVPEHAGRHGRPCDVRGRDGDKPHQHRDVQPEQPGLRSTDRRLPNPTRTPGHKGLHEPEQSQRPHDKRGQGQEDHRQPQCLMGMTSTLQPCGLSAGVACDRLQAPTPRHLLSVMTVRHRPTSNAS
jgi:hypothetical protein